MGAASVALGIWLRVDSTSVIKFLKFVPSDQNMSSAGSNWSYVDVISIVLIVVGAFLIIVGFCGCCGAWKEILFLLWLVRPPTYFTCLRIKTHICISICIAQTHPNYSNSTTNDKFSTV